MKNQRAIIAAAVMAVGMAYAKTHTERQKAFQKLHDKAKADALKTPIAVATAKFFDVHFPNYDVKFAEYWNGRNDNKSYRLQFSSRDSYPNNAEIRLPVNFDAEQLTASTKMLVLGVSIGSDRWERNLAAAIRNEITKCEVQEMLAGKNFQLCLKDLFTRIGIDADTIKLLAAPKS